MHIADGVLPMSSLAVGWAGTVAATALTLKKLSPEELPKAAVMTAAFFVASLVHVPLGPTSVHLLLNGLVGIVLGPAAFPAILVGLVLQALLFQHGGLLSLGANALMLGLPALAAWQIFAARRFVSFGKRDAVAGFLAGAVSILLSGLILAAWLASGGQEFWPLARLALAAHLPIMVIEGLVGAAAAVFLNRVKPEILWRPTHAGN